MNGPITRLAYRLSRSNADLRRENGRLRSENAACKRWIRTMSRDLSIALEMSDNEVEVRRTLLGLHRIDLAPEGVEP